MTDKEIIIVIKAMKDPVGDGDYWKGYNAALDDLLSFIDSTEEEAVCTGIGDPKEESGVLGGMIREMKEGPVSEELEEAARRYAGIPEDSPHDLNYCVQDKKAKYDAVLFGAKWQKRQIMKDVVETKVVGIMKSIVSGSYGCVEIKGDYKIGDRVNILILRED